MLHYTKPVMRQAGSQLRCEMYVHRVMHHTCVHIGKTADEHRVVDLVGAQGLSGQLSAPCAGFHYVCTMGCHAAA